MSSKRGAASSPKAGKSNEDGRNRTRHNIGRKKSGKHDSGFEKKVENWHRVLKSNHLIPTKDKVKLIN